MDTSGADDPYLWVTVHADTTPAQIVVRGELDAASAGQLILEIDAVTAASSDVALDLAAVTFMDSSGLRSLIEAYRRSQAEGFELRVTAASASVQRVFDLTGTSSLLAP